MEFKSYGELNQLVDKNGGVISCEMRFLRDAHGAGKLGINVIQNISEELDKLGLGHWPTELPQIQWQRARVYRKGSKIAQLYLAADQVDERHDAILRDLSESSADVTLKRIKELVCG